MVNKSPTTVSLQVVTGNISKLNWDKEQTSKWQQTASFPLSVRIANKLMRTFIPARPGWASESFPTQITVRVGMWNEGYLKPLASSFQPCGIEEGEL